MAKDRGGGLKRDAKTAFGEDSGQNAEHARRQKASAAKQKQQQQTPTTSSKRSREKQPVSENQNKPAKTPRASKPVEAKSKTRVPEIKQPDLSPGHPQPQQAAKRRPIDRRTTREPTWALSVAEGGRFISEDAILVKDDSYLLVAVPNQVLVYLTATSQLVRSMRITDHDRFTSFTLSRANPNHVLVSTYSGLLLEWDWATGEEVMRWRSQPKLLRIADQIQFQTNGKSYDLRLIHEGSGDSRTLSQVSLADTSKTVTSEKSILEYQSASSWIKFFPQAKCVVLHAQDRLLLGQLPRKVAGTQSNYTWRKIVLPHSITSIDARSHPKDSGSKKTSWAVDVVIGCGNGVILIYEDVLSRLMAQEKSPQEGAIIPRRFHWHRNEVLTVKWSLDGNYIISGGHETVLVIWQLDTGHQQYLPHLSAAILNLTISRTGSCYAVHLADNSVVILSASELQPTAYIGGISLGKRRRNEKGAKKVAAAIPHADATSIALAVAADYSVRGHHAANATLLQIYDLHLHKHVARQALARNNITVLNVDPSGKPTQEPDVSHLQLSHDGNWLATVDQWTQPDDESDRLQPTSESPNLRNREVFLKFWSRDESTRSWHLVTKVESPHAVATASSDSILDLKANPKRTEFSTISSSGSINIWTPKRRHRGGLPMKGDSGSGSFIWTSTHTVDIPDFSYLDQSNPHPIRSSLAYSPDGSVLATSSNQSAFVTFIDPKAGTIRHTQRGSYPAAFSELGFLGHYLITISKDMRVYNAVSGELLWAIALDSSVRDVFLAANEADKTFAIAFILPHTRSSGKRSKGPSAEGPKTQTQICVFQLHRVDPIHTEIVDRRLEILLPLSRESGYLIIDDDAEIRRLQSLKPAKGDGHRQALQSGDHEQEQAAAAAEAVVNPTAKSILALEALKREWRALEDSQNEQQQKLEDNRYDDQTLEITYKTQSSLAEVFERSTTDLPVRTLFDRVFGALKGEKGVE